MKTTKIWLGVGVAVVAGTAPAAQADSADLLNTTAIASSVQPAAPFASSFQLAQTSQGQGGENESGAVSYTHLDVYKRQPRI